MQPTSRTISQFAAGQVESPQAEVRLPQKLNNVLAPVRRQRIPRQAQIGEPKIRVATQRGNEGCEQIRLDAIAREIEELEGGVGAQANGGQLLEAERSSSSLVCTDQV